MRLLKIVPDNTNIGFVKLRYFAFGFTILLTLASLALLFTRGLNLGVDFVGGLMIEARFEKAVDVEKLREEVNAQGAGEAALQQFGSPNTILIRLPLPPMPVTSTRSATWVSEEASRSTTTR